ncbi:LADA_0B07052g1_1 [Lachancea dasiensis]|uniref:LADA_0B07052g1_1 n=1 Tax=Lachancea dasiensis TaxID=1072105 RepID=A0A1G4IUF9_9SACH|nr:LADA_0B07052g1_1 [Lachancea dasiensis]
MNKTFLQWRLGKLDSYQFYEKILQNEIDKLKEAKTEVYNYRKSRLSIGVTSLALDSTGQFLLASGEDGSVALWALDESCSDGQLVNKRVHFARAETRPAKEKVDEKEYLSQRHVVMRRPISVSTTNHSRWGQGAGAPGGSSGKFQASIESSIPRRDHDPQVGFHAYSVTSVKWYSSDNGLFFTGSNDHKVKIWDTNTFQVASSYDLGLRVAQLDACADLVAVATEDSHPRLLDLRSMSATISLGVKRTDMREGINTAKFSRHDTNSATAPLLLATGDNAGNVRVWDLRMSNQALCDLTEPDTMAKAHARCCNDICWDPNGSLELVTTGNDGKCKMWALHNSQSRLIRQLGATDVMANRFRRRTSHYLMWEGPYVFCNSDHGEILVYQSSNGRQWHSFQYPLSGSRDRLITPRFQSMVMQTGLANSIGVRLVFGTDNTHGKIVQYKV